MMEKTESNTQPAKVDGGDLSRRITDELDRVRETDTPTVDSKIFGFLEKLAQEKGATFSHADSALEHLRLSFGNEVAVVEKVYVGGTAGHSDGKLTYRAKRSEIEEYPWWKSAFEELNLGHSIDIIED